MSLMETDIELHHTALAVQRLNLEWSQRDKGQVRQIQVSEDDPRTPSRFYSWDLKSELA